MKAFVYVTLKKSVLDPQGKTIQGALKKLGYSAVSDVRQEDTQSGPIVKSKSFRVAGKKDLMKEVKEHDGHLVDVTGIVKKSSLIEPGIKVGKSVTIGGGAPVAGSGGTTPIPHEYIPVLDAESVRMRASSCGSGGN